MNAAVLVAIVVAIIVVVIPLAIYNRLVTLRNTVQSSWHGIDVELQRRHDLIPNLVRTVKGYAAHEREVLERVTTARSDAVGAADTAAAKAGPEQELSGALRSMFAVAEGYPDLKAATNFLALQNELTDTENRLALARRIYNANVQTYDSSIQRVPNVLVAKLCRFEAADFFRIDSAVAVEAPVADFDGSAPADTA